MTHSTLHPRRGEVNSFYLLVFGGVISLFALGWVLWKMGRTIPSADTGTGALKIYCAAGQRLVVEQIAKDYKDKYGEEIQIEPGGSADLLAKIELSKTGDIFLAADDWFTEQARKKGLIDETIPVATQKPVIAVRRGNPLKIHAIDDLLRKDVRTALAEPKSAAIGAMAEKLLKKAGTWDALEKHVMKDGSFHGTVNEAANSVELNASDAAIVWDNTLHQYKNLEAVSTPELDAGLAHVTLAILKSSERPTSALKFARYLTAADRGLLVFKEHGFSVVDGDTWSELPELVFYCGAVNRRAVEPVIDAFQDREGVRVITSYDGCGTLSSVMRNISESEEGRFPDTYMACDVFYLQNVADLFQESVNVSDTDIVIAVKKGNPLNIQSLEDLNRDKVRVAVGQAEKCTIGALTQKMLQSENLAADIKDNVVTETLTSASLIPPVIAGTADAALAYATDTMAESDKIDAIPIKLKSSKAVQPFSIARSSKHKELARRLYQAVSRSKHHFEAAGFHWRLDDPPVRPVKTLEGDTKGAVQATAAQRAPAAISAAPLSQPSRSR